MSNKTTAIYDFIVSNDLDIFAVTESWMKGKGNDKVERIYEHEILPKTHHMINMPRPDGRKGGGIAVFHRKELRIEVLESSGTSSKQFKYSVCLVKIFFIKLWDLVSFCVSCHNLSCKVVGSCVIMYVLS